MSNQELTAAAENNEEEVVTISESSAVETPSETEAARVDEESPEITRTTAAAPSEEEASDTSETTTETAAEPLSIHNLQVGQRLVGRVKNIANFGAFVDVGIPQDGLVHISKLAKHKVEKVEDEVSQGQEVEVWVKKVDKKRGRLSLTMIKPVLRKLKDIEEGAELKGVITRLEPYGAFVDIDSDRDGLVHISQITHDYINHPEEALNVGDEIKVKVLSVNRKKRQVDLSIKALLPPPVKEAEPERPREDVSTSAQRQDKKSDAEQSSGHEPVSEEAEPMLTAMAVAYAALQSKDDEETPQGEAAAAKEKRRKNEDMDNIVARTLASREK